MKPLLYPTSQAWRAAETRSVALFGMSGVGKTRAARLLRDSGEWFHYSVDYRIGTRYLGERIVDEFKREAMKVPVLRELLRSDSIYIASNITFENLSPLATWLGKPGDPDRGGLPFAEYLERQARHREAEIAALHDAEDFIGKAREIYGYRHFLCDAGGSICELVDPENPADPLLTRLSRSMLLVRIRETDAMADELARRFARNPKPMYYEPEFLRRIWAEHLAETGADAAKVDPDAFIRWGFRRLLARRRPLYAAIARHWGVTVEAEEIAALRSAEAFDALIADALARPELEEPAAPA